MSSVSPQRVKLTDARVAALTAPMSGQEFIWDSEVRGFGVRITPTGTKSWIAQAKINKSTRRETIGRCDRLPIRFTDENGREAGARHRAKQLLLQMADGIDPREAKRVKAAKEITLQAAVDDYLLNNQTKNGELRPNTKRDIEQAMDSTFADWLGNPVSGITRAMCRELFEKITKTAPVKANRDFRYLRAVLNRARENGATEDGQYTILPINPVTHLFRKNGLVKWNPVGKSKTKIPTEKIGEVFNLLEQLADQSQNIETMYTSADLLLFLLLTGCRVGEARSLTWINVDLAATVPTFNLPKDIVKNHHAIKLPVSGALRQVMERRVAARRDENQFVFPAYVGKTGHVTDPRAALRRVDKVAGVRITPHALRRTFEFIALTAGVDSDQRRLLLNHVSGDTHSLHYSNADEPSALLPAVEKVGAWVLEQAAAKD